MVEDVPVSVDGLAEDRTLMCVRADEHRKSFNVCYCIALLDLVQTIMIEMGGVTKTFWNSEENARSTKGGAESSC